jgi:hypothetical protein
LIDWEKANTRLKQSLKQNKEKQMAKKAANADPDNFTPDTEGFASDVQDMEAGQPDGGLSQDGDMDFSLNDEYKPTPLVPGGNYLANVVGVAYNKQTKTIIWKVTLDGNDGTCSDGETDVNGITLTYRNWLPKPGDEDEITKDGRQNKRQAKINMMKDFADNMKINMDTPKVIADSIAEALWVGIRVLCVVSISEYQGRYRNEINSMKAAE